MKNRNIILISLLVIMSISIATIFAWQDRWREQEKQTHLDVKAMHDFYYNETLKVKSEVKE